MKRYTAIICSTYRGRAIPTVAVKVREANGFGSAVFLVRHSLRDIDRNGPNTRERSPSEDAINVPAVKINRYRLTYSPKRVEKGGPMDFRLP